LAQVAFWLTLAAAPATGLLAGASLRFARWQAVRADLQAINFGVLLWALVAVADAIRAS
jgi:hypothetical protein